MQIQYEVAKKLIEKHNNKEQGQSGNKSRSGDNEKISQLEQENIRLTTMLQAEYTNFKLVSKDNKKLQRLNSQLLTINHVLLKSNKNVRTRLQEAQYTSDGLLHSQLPLLSAVIAESSNNKELDQQSSVLRLLREISEAKSRAVSPNHVQIPLEATADRSRKVKNMKEGVRELAIQLNNQVSQLRIVQDVKKGIKIQASERAHRDDDKKAWSFREDNEKQETNFESKRDEIQTSFVLDGI